MAYNAITDTEIQVKKPVSQTLWQKVKDCIDYLYGKIGTLGSSETVTNGSFEIDADADGIPDGWTRSLYPGGSGSFETTSPAHGAKAYKFVHPGGASNGGGYLESDYIEVSEYKIYTLSFIHWASASGMKNKVQVRYFDKSKVELSSGSPVDIYNSTSNPSSPVLFAKAFNPPATARYIKIKLIGGFTDINVAGSAYFDDIQLSQYQDFQRRTPEMSGSTISTNYVDIASTTLYNIVGGASLVFTARLKSASSGSTAYMRFQLGTDYSNVLVTTSTEYVESLFTFSNVSGGKAVTLKMQLANGQGDDAYGSKSDPAISGYLEVV